MLVMRRALLLLVQNDVSQRYLASMQPRLLPFKNSTIIVFTLRRSFFLNLVHPLSSALWQRGAKRGSAPPSERPGGPGRRQVENWTGPSERNLKGPQVNIVYQFPELSSVTFKLLFGWRESQRRLDTVADPLVWIRHWDIRVDS